MADLIASFSVYECDAFILSDAAIMTLSNTGRRT